MFIELCFDLPGFVLDVARMSFTRYWVSQLPANGPNIDTLFEMTFFSVDWLYHIVFKDLEVHLGIPPLIFPKYDDGA